MVVNICTVTLSLVLTPKSIDVYIWRWPHKPTNPRVAAVKGEEGIRNKGMGGRWKAGEDVEDNEEEEKQTLEPQEEKVKTKINKREEGYKGRC
ncbi:hypothetical protein E2C01_041856 [Portunus trituberculatus]|uniref:Uncharacterized protein n=1 Tax=Portunus trituberculatus TaxID=210409 RepID=A0A5B7FKY5_PORTR|nr:hypothetical protein [Portunus trituberculatus]